MQHFRKNLYRYVTDSRKVKNKQQVGRSLRFETCEPRMMLSCSTLSGADPSAILPEQTTGFLSANPLDHSATIDLAQNHQVTSTAVGSGEATASSPVHYASPSGGGDGTQGSPWSLAQANSQLQAGDTLYLTAGDYVGQIRPSSSGTVGNPIRIMAAPGLNAADVHVRGVGSTPAIRVSSNYVLVEGFTVSFQGGFQVTGGVRIANNVYVTGHHVTVRNMRAVHDASEAEGPVGPGQFGEHVCQTRLSGRPQEYGINVAGHHNLIQNNFIKNMYTGVILGTDKANASFNVIRGNTIHDSVWDGIYIGSGLGAPLNHLVESNVISGGLVSDGITFNGQAGGDSNKGINRVIVRNNAIFNFTENAIDLKDTKNIVLEGNYFWGSIGDNDGSGVVAQGDSDTDLENDQGGGAGGIHKGGSTTFSNHVIIRNNVIADNNQGTIAGENYKVYNNTVLNNRRSFSGPNQPTGPLSERKPRDAGVIASNIGPDAAILNNVFGDHGYEIVLRPGTNAEVDGNTYFNTFQTVRFGQYDGNGAGNWSSHTFASWKTWLQSKSGITGDEANSQVVSGPSSLFVNVPGQVTGDPSQFNFSLKQSSSGIDSGVFLTTTTGSGSGTSMSVGDAKMFFDGYGITLGDEIQLEDQTATARITSISGNTLTLDTALSWTSGTGVSLAYEGASPDAGAIEYGEPITLAANPDFYVTSEDTAVTTTDVLANDSVPVGGTLSIQSFTQPTNGAVVDNGNNTFTYTPDNGFDGVDTFTYTVSDGLGATDVGTVSITVTPAIPLTANPDFATTTAGTSVTTPDVLANDTAAVGATLSVQSFTQPNDGSVVDSGNGTFTYTPNANFSGADSFTYTAIDGLGGTDVGTVNLTVSPAGTLISEDFSGASLSNFTIVSGGNWAVSGGELQLTSPANGSPLGNVILHNTPTPGDFTITTEGELVSPTSTWGDFNVIFNYQDANNYYYVNFNQKDSTATNGIQKYENGVVTELADYGDANLISVATDYEIKVVRAGDVIEVYRDSVLLVSINDSSYMGGQMGFASKNDGVAFDNLVVNGAADNVGDFDTDGDVDGADFLSWQRGFGSSTNGSDLTDWQDNYGAGSAVVATSTAVAPVTVAAVSADAEALPSDLSVILALDLQANSSSSQPAVDVVFDEADDTGDALPVGNTLAQPSAGNQGIHATFDIELEETEEEPNDESLDMLFDLLGSSIS